jgi:transcriptional regulator with XRE-family HTH domain
LLNAFYRSTIRTARGLAFVKVKERRRKRLELLVKQRNENWKELAKALGFKTGAYLSQIRSGVRELGEDTAREWERKLRLTPGWFDQDTSDAAPAVADVSPEMVANVAVTVRHVVERDLRGKITDSQFHRLVSLAYVQALKLGAVDEEYIRQLAGLMAPE